jgi:hypothetical protein
VSENNGWAEYKLLVMNQLSTMTAELKDINTKLDGLNNSVLILKVKAGVYGGIAGFVITALTTLIIKYL